MKLSIRLILFLTFISVFAVSALAQESGDVKQNSRTKFHKKVFTTLERSDTESFSVAFDFRGDGTIPSLGASSISIQMIVVKRTADGKVDNVTNVGAAVKLEVPSIPLVKETEEQTVRPSTTMRSPAGVDAISVSIRDSATGSTKQFFLRLPMGQGTTTGEIRF